MRFPPVAAPRIARAGTERPQRARPQETLYRLQKYSVKYANDYDPPPSWYDRASANVSDYPGLGAAERCVDWMWALPVHRVGKIGEEAYREGEARRFAAFLGVISCNCRFTWWQHMASMSWWMAAPRYFGVREMPEAPRKRAPLFPFRWLPKRDTFVYELAAGVRRGAHQRGDSPRPEADAAGAHFGAAVIDEVWDVANLSAELASMLERFDVRATDEEGADAPLDARACVGDGADAGSYTGSTEEKDASGGREFGLASAEYLEMLRSAGGGRHLVEVCDMLAQDYICFGFEPPEGCGRLAALMREHGLLSSPGGGRL